MSGFHAWMLQRLTALVVGILLLIAFFVISTTDISWIVWKEWHSSVWVRLGVLLFALSLFMHAWIGVRNVIVDTIHLLGLRLLLLSTSAIFLIINAFWLLLIILGAL